MITKKEEFKPENFELKENVRMKKLITLKKSLGNLNLTDFEKNMMFS